jgi:hypothetical protein
VVEAQAVSHIAHHDLGNVAEVLRSGHIAGEHAHMETAAREPTYHQ